MKAAIYNGKKSISIVEKPTPICGPHDVLLQTVCASICGTDVAVYQHGPGTGHRITIGSEFGHEAVCRVAAVGEQVKDFQVGQRIYPYPLLVTGDSKRAGTMGAFSEYILAPNAKWNEGLYVVPDEIDDKTAALIEPFTVGTRAARRSQPKVGESAIVFGAGTIGIAAAIALKEFGCQDVLVCDLSDFRLEKVQALGFPTCNTDREKLEEKASKLFGTTRGLDSEVPNVDIYLDAAGAPTILEQFLNIGKIGSRMVVVAVLAGQRPVDILRMTYAQQSLIGSGGYFPEDVRDVMTVMGSQKYDISSIITHEFPQNEIAKAIEVASDTNRSLNIVISYL
ncbi:MAG: zinc-binding dehydrogenase [Clostridiales bacterium]|nr:zinc-binding dehydrogenase [Clostridiales bacterium]